jgi:predicted neutral ceramidase superfamily lipid hydrolase
MLERMVGAVERNETLQPIGQVLRTLPWVRLFLADVVLLVLAGVAALLIVLPGLVLDTVFALVGPLINLLGCTVPQAFRRSVTLVWPHFILVFCFVAIPLALEHEVLVLVHELVPHESVGLVFASSFLVGTTFGIGLGLTEVSLAERLVRGAHGPGGDVRSEDVELPDSMA